jgi:hypothetical protein
VVVSLSAQNGPEIVRGTIVDTGRAPIADAIVTITPATGEAAQSTKTDKLGRFQAMFPEGVGSYSILVRKIGFRPGITRVARSGLSNVLMTALTLAPAPYALEPLTVTQPRINRGDRPERPSIGGASTAVATNRDFLDDPSDIDAMTALTPGVFAQDSGYSVMGTSNDQNGTVVDGVNFSGGLLPPDAMCGATVSTTTSDPSRGRFAGGQTSITTCRGHDFFESTIRGSLLDPALSWSDQQSLVTPSRIGTVSGFLSGPLQSGSGHYRLSAIANSSERSPLSLLSAPSDLEYQFGIAPDSLGLLITALRALHVPLSTGVTSSAARQLTTAFSMDLRPTAATSLLITANGSAHQSTGVGISPLAFPASAGEQRRYFGQAMVRGTTLVGDFVDEFSAAWSGSSTSATPYASIPGGSVLVQVARGDSAEGPRALAFGAGLLATRSTEMESDTRNQLSWLAGHGAQQLFLGQELVVDWGSSQPATNTLGTYAFQTLSGLIADEPTSFTRNLQPVNRSSHDLFGSVWLGDIWRVSHPLSVQGGLRVDADAYGPSPPYNAAADSVFGVRTDRIPFNATFEPRLGFALLIKQRPIHYIVVNGERHGVVYIDDDNAAVFGATAPRGNVGAGITLYGNVGAYSGRIPPGRLNQITENTGLAGSTRQLACVGPATPIPDWSGTTSPDACVGPIDTNGTNTAVPVVAALDRSYRAPVDWKLNLGIDGLYWWNTWAADLSIILKHGTHYDSWIDGNLRDSPSFTLPDEANRPVYVDPRLIVEQTGGIPATGSRIDSRFAMVDEIRSDLTSDAIQLHATIGSGPLIFPRLRFRLDYTLNAQRNQYRGFGGTTGGDPRAIASSSGAQPIHQFVLNTPTARIGWIAMSLRLAVQSGIGYTPIVAADINGDGLSNDRAFVPDPSATADTLVAAEMRALLATAPSSARSCLDAQLNHVSGTNSCRGPWQARLDLNASLASQGIGLGDRLKVTARFVNAGAAIMRLLGVTSGLSQGNAQPDSRLLYVTGFDPALRRFSYQVNPAFGQPFGAGVQGRQFPPFQVQIGLEYELAGAPTNPWLRDHGLAPAKHQPYTRAQVRLALGPILRNPIDTILRMSDSLHLTSVQVTQIHQVASAYQSALDSVTEDVVSFVLRRAAKLNDSEMIDRERQAVAKLNPARSAASDKAVAILLPEQQRKLESLLGRSLH